MSEYIIKCVCYCLKEQSPSTPDMKVHLEQNKDIEISNDIYECTNCEQKKKYYKFIGATWYYGTVFIMQS